MSKDTLIRAGKTFVQAFFGIFIPELVTALNSPEILANPLTYLTPAVCAGIACGISAVWNYILEVMKDDEETEFHQ